MINAVLFGIRVVNNEQELREAARVIFDKFSQGVLVEQYIDGRVDAGERRSGLRHRTGGPGFVHTAGVH